MPSARQRARTAKRIREIVLPVAISIGRRLQGRLKSHDLATAVPALFAAADATVSQRFGVRGVEMPATALGAFDPASR